MNFNRRQNRIAGPGFHINVRYDDQTMDMARRSQMNIPTVLNKGRTHVENYDVKEQELLVCKESSGMYHDGYTHCFSFANGLSTTKSVEDADAVASDILKQVKFVGVATTEYKPSKAYSEQGFVAQVGGVTTLINEGKDIIKPGDSVSLGLNLSVNRRMTRDKGIPRDKIRFCLVKTKNTTDMIAEALKASDSNDGTLDEDFEELKETVDSLAMAKKQEKDSLRTALEVKITDLQKKVVCDNGVDGMKKFLDAYQRLNERVIGKAASYARPGDRLEVVLQPRNPY